MKKEHFQVVLHYQILQFQHQLQHWKKIYLLVVVIYKISHLMEKQIHVKTVQRFMMIHINELTYMSQNHIQMENVSVEKIMLKSSNHHQTQIQTMIMEDYLQRQLSLLLFVLS